MQSYQISNVELLDYQLAAINTESISLVFSLFNEISHFELLYRIDIEYLLKNYVYLCRF